MPFDEIYFGKGKPVADAYVDDRAIECDEYSNIEDRLKRIEYLTGLKIEEADNKPAS